MGIHGLIPFVKCCTEKLNFKELSGKTVAVDSYCWLHKGVIGCAEKLLIGDDCTQYVEYCLKIVKCLLSNNVKVIMVFDGRSLPAKEQEETCRQKTRASAKKMAQQHLRVGNRALALRCMFRSVDVTHSMALKLIQACRQINVDCIVAPYEADAQLTFLNINKIVEFVITEDSDLILFGCTKIIFKFTINGEGLLFDNENLHQTMNLSKENWDFKHFRRMCILSGCDYLPSLQGIGLVKAKKFVLQTRDLNFYDALSKMGRYLKIKNLDVPDSYIKKFMKCEATFMYQYVYDPIKRKQVNLTKLPLNTACDLLTETGEMWNSEEAFQHALGNIDPVALTKVDDWNPDNCKLLSTSIWKKGIQKVNNVKFNKTKEENIIKETCKIEQVQSLNYEELLSMYTKSSSSDTVKRKHEDSDVEINNKKHKVINPFLMKHLEESGGKNSIPNHNLNKTSPKYTLNETESLPIETSTSLTSTPKVRSPVFKSVKCNKSFFLRRSISSRNVNPKISCFFKTDSSQLKSEQLQKDSTFIDSTKKIINEDKEQKLLTTVDCKHVFQSDIKKKMTKVDVDIEEINNFHKDLLDMTSYLDVGFHTHMYESYCRENMSMRKDNEFVSPKKISTIKKQKQSLLEKFGYVKKSMDRKNMSK